MTEERVAILSYAATTGELPTGETWPMIVRELLDEWRAETRRRGDADDALVLARAARDVQLGY